jgi:integrase
MIPAVSEPDPLHVAFVLLILHGLLRDEVLGLRWQDIDFEAGTCVPQLRLSL